MSYERRMEELTKPQSLQLLSTVQVGRLAFVHHALPAIRPVNHLVDGDLVIVRATAGAAITEVVGHRGMVVAYEADAIDTARQVGWSVVVVGTAHVIVDQHVAARYRALLKPWVAGAADAVISISTDMVHGYRLVPGDVSGDSHRDAHTSR